MTCLNTLRSFRTLNRISLSGADKGTKALSSLRPVSDQKFHTMEPNHDEDRSSTSTDSSNSTESDSSSDSQNVPHVSLAQAYLLDIVTFMYMLYVGLLNIPLTDVMLKKSCYFELKYNDTICQALNKGENHQYLNEVRRITKFYGLASNIAASLPAAVSTIIASNYIARFGMKRPVICAIAGTATTCALQLYSFAQMDLPLYFNVIFQIPQALSGGLLVLVAAVHTRIALITSPENRKYRYFFIRYLILIANLIGVAIVTPIYKNLGPPYLASTLITSLLVPLILMIFVFEDRGFALEENFFEALRISADFSSLKDGLACVKQERQGHARAQIYFMLIASAIASIPYAGTDNLEQLYVNKLYGWDASWFAVITSYSLLAVMIASVVIIFVFTEVLHLTEPSLMLLSYSLYAAKLFSKSLMFLGEFVFWIQLALGVPLVVGTTAASSHLTRLVAPRETAVIFGLSSSFDHVAPLFVDIGFSAIYAATIHSFAGAVFIVEGLIFLFPVVFAGFCAHWIRTEGYPNYERLENETEED